jgi:hypothetical protein
MQQGMLAHLSQTLTPKHLEISKEVEGKMVEVDEEEEVMLIHRRKRSIVLIVERKKSLCKQASLSSESLREETFVSIDEYSDALAFTMKIYTKAEEVSAKRAYEVLQTRGFPLIMEEIHLVEDDIFSRMPEISRDDQSGL